MNVDVSECSHLMPKFLCRSCSAHLFPARAPFWAHQRSDPTPRPSHYAKPTIELEASASLPDIPRTVERYRPKATVQRYRPKENQE